MYDLYFHKSPNTYKVAMFFEEADLAYRTVFVNVGAGEQFTPEFVAISPNSKVPVIRDYVPTGSAEPVVIFESGSILLYLAEKIGDFILTDTHGRCEVLQWLFWQMACQGPMCGQSVHFNMFAPESSYARERYLKEARRLFKVLDRRLADREYVAGSRYTIADMACYPWVSEKARICVGIETLDGLPNLKRWAEAIAVRPAVVRAFARLDEDENTKPELEEFAAHMFGHDREQAKQAAANARTTFARIGLQFGSER